MMIDLKNLETDEYDRVILRPRACQVVLSKLLSFLKDERVIAKARDLADRQGYQLEDLILTEEEERL